MEQQKIQKQQKTKRYFISPLNTYLGNNLVQKLRNDQEYPDNANLIVGTLSKDSTNNVPEGVRKAVDGSKLTLLQKVLLDSDVVIYDLLNCDLSEAEFAIKTLKMGDLREEKILIFISSVMVWSSTPPKEKKEGDEPDEAEVEEPDSDPEKVEEQTEDEPSVKKEYVRFAESDYTRRQALPKYEVYKSLESLCLSAGNSKENLRSYVLCAGILYGMGENVFFNHFKAAWLQEPKQLGFYGDGRNRVPTIHVKDLSLFVQKVAERPPQISYIFAIDHNSKPQQRKIVGAISRGVGTGEVKSFEQKQEELGDQNQDILSIDLRMRPSKAFDQFIEEANQQEENLEEGNETPKYTFNWWCKEGIQKNISKINTEFNKNNKLLPIRVFITGAPAVGKSFWAKQLLFYYSQKQKRISEFYNLPHINIKDVIEKYKNLQNEEAEALRSSLEEQRATLVEEAQALWELDKKKRKALGKAVEPFDEAKIFPRLNASQLYLAFKWRLMQNDCQNRGYVLDGYPKSYQDVRGVFMKSERQGEDDADKEDDIKVIDRKINPLSVIVMDASDEYLVQRVQQIPESQISGTHYLQEGMKRRLSQYRTLNKLNTGWPIMVDFFQENGVQALFMDVMNKQNKIFEQSKAFIEREGKFNNYRDNVSEKEAIRLIQVNKQRGQKESDNQINQQTRDEKEMLMWKIQEEEYKIKLDQARTFERELLDSRSQPLRQYLNDNVVPFITEGLVELIKSNTNDPVDFLAEFLFKRSLQVNYPDPGKYFEEFNQK